MARSALPSAHVQSPLIYAAPLGTNIGPNLTLSGSLATLLVREAARKKGETLGAKDFLKVGLCVTPLTLLAAVLALWATFLVVR